MNKAHEVVLFFVKGFVCNKCMHGLQMGLQVELRVLKAYIYASVHMRQRHIVVGLCVFLSEWSV